MRTVPLNFIGVGRGCQDRGKILCLGAAEVRFDPVNVSFLTVEVRFDNVKVSFHTVEVRFDPVTTRAT